MTLAHDGDNRPSVQAIRHLLAVDRKRIAFVGGPPTHLANQLRRQGAEQALAAAGLSLAAQDLLQGQWSEAWGRAAAGVLIRRPTRRT